MFCEKCGAKLQAGVRFCSNCGSCADNAKPAVNQETPKQNISLASNMGADQLPLQKKGNGKFVCMLPLLLVALSMLWQILSLLSMDIKFGFTLDRALAAFFDGCYSLIAYTAIIAILPVLLRNRWCAKAKKGAFICLAILSIVAFVIHLSAALICTLEYLDVIDSKDKLYWLCFLIPGRYFLNYLAPKTWHYFLRDFIWFYVPTISMIPCSFIAAAKAGNRGEEPAAQKEISAPVSTAVSTPTSVLQTKVAEKEIPLQKSEKFCRYCGEKAESAGRFCINCGKEI